MTEELRIDGDEIRQFEHEDGKCCDLIELSYFFITTIFRQRH